MKQRLLIVLFTALVFGAGYGAHGWFAEEVIVPPPPVAIGSEFSHGPGTPAAASTAGNSKNAKLAPPPANTPTPLDRPKLLAEITKYSSQIKTYQTRLDQLDAEFDKSLLPMLSIEQRGRYAALQKRLADRRAKGQAAIAAETAPLSDEQIFRLQQRPLFGVLSSVSITMRFDQLNKEVKLAPDQAPKVRSLLIARREQFLDLVDSSPPPTITLSQLAAHVEKIGADTAKFEPPK